MTPLEVSVVLTRWAHLMATVAWLGGNLFFLVVLRPSLRRGGAPRDLARRIGGGFKEVVDLSMWVLVITGGILIFDRLTAEIGLTYAYVLAVKLLLSALMFLVALSLSRRGPQRRSSPLEGTWTELLPPGLLRLVTGLRSGWTRWLSPTNLLIALGPLIVFLGVLLRSFS